VFFFLGLVGALVYNPPPRPPRPHPRFTTKLPHYAREKTFSLTIPITCRDNQSRQRRCAPTVIGIAGTLIAFTQNP
jgi:hypothetical protein